MCFGFAAQLAETCINAIAAKEKDSTRIGYREPCASNAETRLNAARDAPIATSYSKTLSTLEYFSILHRAAKHNPATRRPPDQDGPGTGSQT